MTSLQIVLSDNKTDFVTEFNPPMHLNNPCEMSLINLETYYSIPNIHEGNNEFRLLKEPRAGAWDFKLKTGSYDLIGINNTVESITKSHGLYNAQNNTYPISFKANHNTFKTIMHVEMDYVIDFTQNSLNKILGFNPIMYTSGTYESEKVVDILAVNSILVNLDIIGGSYVKGVKS